MMYTDSTKYAIRAMIHIAAHGEDRLVTSGEIAEARHIPQQYLAKILQALVRADMLISARGRGGGFRLGRKAREITVYDIVGAVERPDRLRDECILGIDACDDEVPCPLHDTWKEFRDTALASIESMTLERLAREQRDRDTRRGAPAAVGQERTH